MMTRIRHITLGLMIAALIVPAGTALANSGQNTRDHNNAQSRIEYQAQPSQRTNNLISQFAQNQSKRKISASRAKSAAMSRVRGAKFVNVQLVNQNTYRVRLQKNGQIIDVYVDAYTGQVRN